MIALDTQPGEEGRPNEDWCGVTTSGTAGVAVVLDGLSAPAGTAGCSHGTPWFVERLGAALLDRARSGDLRAALAAALDAVAAAHAGSCDLAAPGGPASTVALLRWGADQVEALVLSDSTVVVDTGEATGPEVVSDTRVDDLVRAEQDAALAAAPGAERERRVADLVATQAPLRNQSGGYWVAGADPGAAEHALVRTWPAASVQRFALLSDGAARLVDFGVLSWAQLLDQLDSGGPSALIAATRTAEATDPQGIRWPRFKPHDDAAAISLRAASRHYGVPESRYGLPKK